MRRNPSVLLLIALFLLGMTWSSAVLAAPSQSTAPAVASRQAEPYSSEAADDDEESDDEGEEEEATPTPEPRPNQPGSGGEVVTPQPTTPPADGEEQPEDGAAAAPLFTPIPRATPYVKPKPPVAPSYQELSERPWEVRVFGNFHSAGDLDYLMGPGIEGARNWGRFRVGVGFEYLGAKAPMPFDEFAQISLYTGEVSLRVGLNFAQSMPAWVEPYARLRARWDFIDLKTNSDVRLVPNAGKQAWEVEGSFGVNFRPVHYLHIAVGGGSSIIDGDEPINSSGRHHYELRLTGNPAKWVSLYASYRGIIMSDEDKESMMLNQFMNFPYSLDEENRRNFVYETNSLQFGVIFKL